MEMILTKKMKERLTRLGVSVEEYIRYHSMFCKNRMQYKYIKKTKDGWSQSNYSWDNNLILRHLLEEATIGLFPANQIDYLIFDIDNHTTQMTESIEHRCREIITAINRDYLIYTSSYSGGMRICYFLDKSYPKEQVNAYAKNILSESGIPVKSGHIEIMAGKKGDRLPFGEDSYLVDFVIYEPLYDVTLSQRIKEAWELSSADRLCIPESTSFHTNLKHPNSDFIEIVTRLYEQGLYPEISTNDALMKLCWDYRTRFSNTAEETASFLKYWIKQRHNGCSDRINAGKISIIEEQIERIVKNYNPKHKKYQKLKRSNDKKLKINDIKLICSLSSEYKIQLAIFSLLEYVKNKGKLIDSIDISKISDKDLKTYLISNLYVTGFQQLSVYSCEIPYKSFKIFPGFDKTYPNKTKDKLIELGLLEPWKREHKDSNRCRTYKIYFNFDKESEEVGSLDEGILKLNSIDEIKECNAPH